MSLLGDSKVPPPTPALLSLSRHLLPGLRLRISEAQPLPGRGSGGGWWGWTPGPGSSVQVGQAGGAESGCALCLFPSLPVVLSVWGGGPAEVSAFPVTPSVCREES